MIDAEKYIEGCKKQDRKCQRKLYELFSRQMFSICLRYCKNATDAEDVLQMGFIKVFKHIDQVSDARKLPGWIRTIMIRTALRFIQQKPDFVMLEDHTYTKEEYEMNLDFDTFTFDKLIKHLHRLPVGYQTVFNLYVFEELNHNEIAKKLNCSESTSRSQLFKARKQLQAMVMADHHLQPLASNRL